MGAAVLLLGAVRLSQGFPRCPLYFKIGSRVWLICIFWFSNWASCEGPPRVKICDQADVLEDVSKPLKSLLRDYRLPVCSERRIKVVPELN